MTRRASVRYMWDWVSLSQYDDDERIAVCLTQREAMILKAALVPAYLPSRWLAFPGGSEPLDILDAMVAKIDSQLDGNDCGMAGMEFRDNPDDPCEVQYSNDGGNTWTKMFRKDVCRSYSPADIINISETKIEITTNNNTWNGDIINLCPDWEWEDADSDKALCWIIDFYVEWICKSAIATIVSENIIARDQNAWWDDVLEELSAGVVAALVFINIHVAAASAVAWGLVNIANELYDLWVTESTEAFEDEDAKDAVKCWMYFRMSGDTPQWEAWTHSMDNFPYSNDNEEAISCSVEAFNNVLDTYINYMLMLEDINSISSTLPDCPCEIALITYQLSGPNGTEMYGTEFTAPSLRIYSNPGDLNALCPGVWDAVTERYNGVASSIGGVGCNIKVALPSNVLVHEIKVDWGAARPVGNSYGDKNAAVYVGSPFGGGTYVGGMSWDGGNWGDRQAGRTMTDIELTVTTPQTHVYFHNSIDREFGTAYTYYIKIECIPYVP